MEDPPLPIENSTKDLGKPAKTPKENDTRDDHPMEGVIEQEDATKEKYNMKELQYPEENLQDLLRYIRRSLRSDTSPDVRIRAEGPHRLVVLSLKIMRKLAKCLDIDISDMDNLDVLMKVSGIIVAELWDNPEAHILKGFFSLLPSSTSEFVELELRDISHHPFAQLDFI